MASTMSVLMLLALCGCEMSTEDIANEAKQMMVDEFQSEGEELVVEDFSLVNEGGNKYHGICKATVDGVDAEFDVNVIYDGETIHVQYNRAGLNEDGTENVGKLNPETVAQAGYKAGYEMGFEMGDFADDDASIAFSTLYGAPMTAEEKSMYQVFSDAYKRGVKEGVSANGTSSDLNADDMEADDWE